MTIKTGALLLCMLAAGHYTHAQRLDVFGGVSLTGISHKIDGKKQDGTGNITSHLGLSVFVPFSMKDYKEDEGGYGIFPALQFIKKGTSKSTIIGGNAADIKLSYLQLDVPLSLTADMIAIGIGPYASYAIGGKKQYRVGNGEKEKIDFAKELKRLDYGLGLHLNISVFKLQYNYGLANIGGNNTPGAARTRSFTLSLDIPLFLDMD